MKFLYFLMLLIPFDAVTQENEVRQLQFLLNDLKDNFIETIGAS